MAQKIRAVKDASHDPDFVLIARTDALAVEGYDKAIERGHAYMEAGADMIFIEAPTSVEQIERIAKDLPYPKLINMFHGGKTPLVGSDRLGELGRSEEHTSELQSLMRISYAVFCLKKKKKAHRTRRKN